MIDTAIKVSEYQARRKKVLNALKGSVGLVMSGDGAPPLRGEWFPNFDFKYLTGIGNEPGAMVLFDPSNPDPKRRCMLLLKPVNPEMDVWDGYRDLVTEKLRKATGFESIFRTNFLPRLLGEAAKRTKSMTCLHPLSTYTQPVSADLDLFQKLSSRIPGSAIHDRSELLTELRMVKSPAEIKHIRSAIKATAEGIDRVFKAAKPGINERELHNALLSGFTDMGAKVVAFDPIVGSGVRSTILHYKENDQATTDGDLMVLDCGAEINGYASDITRTIPISGKFSKRQREVYEIVLKAQRASIKAVKPGATMLQVDAAARNVITDAGYGDYFLHSIGHHMGLETHDPGANSAKLKPGMVVTIEPGIYIKDEAIGIRLEDDILVTKDGRQNLSSSIPISVKDVEAAMKARSKK
ncbi:MAG: Xaa-Pro peptidase family protein [Phycisphaerales bacterium]|nr:Xaa-Pro peptidase family protein [Phycisphaerales bacterium]